MDSLMDQINDDREHGAQRGLAAALRFIRHERRVHDVCTRQNGSHEDFIYGLALAEAEGAINAFQQRLLDARADKQAESPRHDR